MSADILEFPRTATVPPAAPTIDDELFAQLRSVNDDLKVLWNKSKKMDALMFRIRHKILALGAARKEEMTNAC
jgi:hypothetical protein